MAEVLLQRTTASAVARALPDFFTRFPSWEAILESSEDALSESLRPLGLWRRRASALRSLAAVMMRRRGRVPRSRQELEALPGIGQYIASAVLLFKFGDREPLLDVNMARVLERVFGPRKLADIRYDPQLQALARSAVDSQYSKELNWAFLDLGALVCRPRNPKCGVCPLAARCLHARHIENVDVT